MRNRIKRNLVGLIGAALLAAGLLAVATVPVGASTKDPPPLVPIDQGACSTSTVSFWDGDSHSWTFGPSSCSALAFSMPRWDQLGVYPCHGFLNLIYPGMSDCINYVRFNGSWPSNFVTDVYRDINYGGGLSGRIWRCAAPIGTWQQLSRVDDGSSSKTYAINGGCT